MSNGNEGTIEEKQKEMMQRIIDDQNAFDEQFRQYQTQLLDKTSQAQENMLRRLKSKAETSPEIQEIVTMLMDNPKLVEPTKKFIEEKIAQIDAAIQNVLNL